MGQVTRTMGDAKMKRSYSVIGPGLLFLGLLVVLPMSSAPASPQGSILPANNWTYQVGVEVNKQTHVATVQMTDRLRQHILEKGHAGLTGEQAIHAFLSERLKDAVDRGLFHPPSEDILVFDTHGSGEPRTQGICCSYCWDVYRCTYIGGGFYECEYVDTVCGCYRCNP